MSQSDNPRDKAWNWLVAGWVVATALVLASLIIFSSLPSIGTLVLFALAAIWAANSIVPVPSGIVLDPSFMVVMASIAAFSADDPGGAVLGAAIVGTFTGASSGPLIKRRRYDLVLANLCMYTLATVPAAAIYIGISQVGLPSLFAGSLAVLVWAFLSTLFVTWGDWVHYHERAVWADMRDALPSMSAFGVLGVLVGGLFTSLGPVAFILLIVPAAIARSTFKAYTELHESHESTLRVFLRAIEAKDEYTARHTLRVAKYALYMGEWMGFSTDHLEQLRRAALMHDIGKLATPGHLLNKPGKLTEEEYEVVKNHNRVCVDILDQVDFLKPMIATAADRYGHFEAGQGPPDPKHLDSYIVAVADAFDAMTSTRSYRKALPMEVAFQELLDKSGTQFHPNCVEALIGEIERRGEKFGAGHETDAVEFDVPPPVVGVGSAGLGQLERDGDAKRSGSRFGSAAPRANVLPK